MKKIPPWRKNNDGCDISPFVLILIEYVETLCSIWNKKKKINHVLESILAFLTFSGIPFSIFFFFFFFFANNLNTFVSGDVVSSLKKDGFALF